uniref:Uncharacterized protein n=1 Tax=Arundo donax TaxID=35708 RepID=A0A0A9C0F8_ARUDO
MKGLGTSEKAWERMREVMECSPCNS